MKDSFGREINYLRISVTDRCNLRCKYCMPNGAKFLSHDKILSYEEFLRIAKVAVSLGINRFKITGGEPLVRKDCDKFIKELKQMRGVEQVTLTTNGLFLEQYLELFREISLDGINISLDSLDEATMRRISGYMGEKNPVAIILNALQKSVEYGIRTKINAVLLKASESEILPLVNLAKNLAVDVRFIELMPIGIGGISEGLDPDIAINLLKTEFSDLRESSDVRGNGPAKYFKSDKLKGQIGFINAVSHKFCEGCNRMRITSTGFLKECLCFNVGVDFRAILRNGGSDDELRDGFMRAIHAKPLEHAFGDKKLISEQNIMSSIGG